MTGKQTFYGIQILRGVAAIMVVLCHIASTLSSHADGGGGFTATPDLFIGNAGVDLFFVISGFVIVWTTQGREHRPHAWRVFVEKRISRIFPLYWILTTGKVALVVSTPWLFRGTHLQPWNTFASYLLIPSLDAEGRINPIITAGWTLCYEMAFYYVCAICLALRQRPVLIATPLFLVLGAIGFFRTPAWGAIASLIDPLLLEFVAGMWIADLTRRGKVNGSPAAMTALIVLAVVLWTLAAQLDFEQARYWRSLVWGLPGALLLYAVIGLEKSLDFSRLRLPLLIGDASYSIYLSHVLILPVLMHRARQLVLPAVGEWAVLLGLLSVGIGAGVVVWYVVERKIIRGLMQASQPMREAWINPSGHRDIQSTR